MSRPPLPAPIATLAIELADLAGVVAVVLGGSRATSTHRADSDWDLGVYYRGSQRRFEPEGVRRLGYTGHVSELGEWGPVVNGGAWLVIDATPIDVLFRDLDRVETWLGEAREGRFEVLPQNGHVVGAPTYGPVGELALCRPIVGELPRPGFPERLATTAATRWRGNAGVALMFAQIHAGAGEPVCFAGMLAQAVLCTAHARLAERHEWVLNEKRLVERAALVEAQALLGCAGTTCSELSATVDSVSSVLQIEPLAPR